jgi:hypothetical protein
MNMGVEISESFSVTLVIYPQVIAGSYEIPSLPFLGTAILFSTAAAPLYKPHEAG